MTALTLATPATEQATALSRLAKLTDTVLSLQSKKVRGEPFSRYDRKLLECVEWEIDLWASVAEVAKFDPDQAADMADRLGPKPGGE